MTNPRAGKLSSSASNKRNGRVYTEVVTNCEKASIQAILRGRVKLVATVHMDGMRSYDGVMHMGCQKHYQLWTKLAR